MPISIKPEDEEVGTNQDTIHPVAPKRRCNSLTILTNAQRRRHPGGTGKHKI